MAGIAGLLACLFLAMPYLASTRIVSAKIASELAAITGMQVQMTGAPAIRIWPSFAAVLSQPSLHGRTDPGKAPVIVMRSATLALNPVAALSGKIRITGIALEEPELHLDRLAPGDIRLGGLGSMIAANRAFMTGPGAEEARADNAVMQAWAERLPQIVTFTEGRIVFSDTKKPAVSVDGRFAWTPPGGRAKLKADLTWNGQEAEFSAQVDDFLRFLAGGSAEIAINGTAPAGAVSFAGQAALSGDGQINGAFKAEMPSLQAGLGWWGIASAAGPEPFRISALLAGTGNKAAMRDVSLSFGKDQARGALELTSGDGTRSISGTLAFDTLDLGTFIPFAESALALTAAGSPGESIFQKLDLRISAEKASLFDLALAGMASSATLADGRASFLISEASAFGGTLMAGLRSEGGSCTAFMTAKGMDAGSAESALIGRKSLTKAQLDASLELNGPFDGWSGFLGQAEGEFNATLGQGMLAAPDIEAFKKLLQSSGFFGISGVGHTIQPTSGAVIKASIKGGVAQVGTAEIGLGAERVVLRGVAHLADRSLALTGAIDPGDGAAALPFFAGGSWHSPFISPPPKP